MLTITMQRNSRKISEYHNLHVESDILLLADVFENFINKCLET